VRNDRGILNGIGIRRHIDRFFRHITPSTFKGWLNIADFFHLVMLNLFQHPMGSLELMLQPTHKHIPHPLIRIEGGGRLLVAFGLGQKGQETNELIG
ncbi:MAG: hypothetical protein KAT53_04515, partial [Dehalococcoidia bacterium]|nr:hypothetical protein [Dehalococcoidia bacterium]